MPYTVGEDTNACPVGKPWAVKNQATGKVHGCHPSKAKAMEQQKALYANVPDATTKSNSMSESESRTTIEVNEAKQKLPRKSLVRSTNFELQESESDGGMPTMSINFARFNEPTEIDSWVEGRFIEKIDRGAFSKTFRERGGQVKVLFNHGKDPSIGDKVLGPIAELREEGDGAWADVPLLDTSYNRDLLPGLKAGLYGASFRMTVMREEVDNTPERSAANPEGIPERTIKEIKLHEFGPVTFPAYAGATASARSITDLFVEEVVREQPELVQEFIERSKAEPTVEETETDVTTEVVTRAAEEKETEKSAPSKEHAASDKTHLSPERRSNKRSESDLLWGSRRESWRL
jgi:HK97 family phage prohead protease